LTPPVSPSEKEGLVNLPEQAPPRRRLDHAITLGGASEFDTGSYGAPAQAPDARAPTIVNVYVTPGAMPYYGASYGYGGFGPSFIGSPVVRTVGQPAAAVMRPGLDWPAVPSHGPSFPYRTVPASPWESDGTRRR
jgi:hypothetical protein